MGYLFTFCALVSDLGTSTTIYLIIGISAIVIGVSVLISRAVKKITPENAPRRLIKQAEAGDQYTMFKLGVLYHFGRESFKNKEYKVKVNEKSSFEWFLKAAEAGHIEAQNEIGYRYSSGRGVEKDNKLAFDWYLKAAENNNMEAQFSVIRCYSDGSGTQKNSKQAFYWAEKAYDNSLKKSNKKLYYGEASYTLGKMYFDGIGIEQDKAKGISLYEESVVSGYYKAIYALTHCYRFGDGVEKNLRLALHFIEQLKYDHEWKYRAEEIYYSILNELYPPTYEDIERITKRIHNGTNNSNTSDNSAETWGDIMVNNKIIENINNPNYDPESFPDPSEIW